MLANNNIVAFLNAKIGLEAVIKNIDSMLSIANQAEILKWIQKHVLVLI